jgi:4-hydroxybenzoate polyprenyltransferase
MKRNISNCSTLMVPSLLVLSLAHNSNLQVHGFSISNGNIKTRLPIISKVVPQSNHKYNHSNQILRLYGTSFESEDFENVILQPNGSTSNDNKNNNIIINSIINKNNNNANVNNVIDKSSTIEVDNDKSVSKSFYKSSQIGLSEFTNTNDTSTKNNESDGTRMKKNAVPTIKSCFAPLLRMMRLGNFPGVILFHLIGIHKSLSTVYQDQGYNISLLIQTSLQPSLMATLFVLLLIVSTSMIVNDYYDARSGVDVYVDYSKFEKTKQSSSIENHPIDDNQITSLSTGTSSSLSTSHNNKPVGNANINVNPLASGEVPLPIAKKFLGILYGVLLMTITVLPGIPTRLLAMSGLIMTYLYTLHLKPKTWIKNFTCAIIMALTPLTSGYATLNHQTITGLVSQNNGIGLFMTWKVLGPLFCSLFCSFMGREIIMDITDHDSDKNAGICTVPVKYGKRVASKIALSFVFGAGIFISIGPIFELYSKLVVSLPLAAGGLSLSIFNLKTILKVITTPALWRLSSALVGSLWLGVRAMQIVSSEGKDENLMKKTIEEGKLNILFILASSI